MEDTQENELIGIDEAIELIEKQENELAEKKENELAEIEEEPKKEYTIDDITDIALSSYKDISERSDEIYNALYGQVATRIDRTDSSKQTLIESQRIKNESIANLVALANAKAKLANAQAKMQSGNVGVFINSKNGEDVGINLSNLKDD